MTPEVEQRLRAYLWLSHGHAGGYGDDGEMQCGACLPVWDYKRAPLADVIAAAISARMAVNLAALTSQRTDSPSVIAEIPKPASPPPPNGAPERLQIQQLTASLTALREAADQLIVMWRGRANLERRGHWWAMLEDCADELSTALAASREHAQTHRD